MAELENLIPPTYDLLVLRWSLPSGRVATCSIGAKAEAGIGLQTVVDAVYAETVAEFDQITDTNYTFLPSIAYRNTGSGIASATAAGASAPGTAAKATAPCELNIGVRKRTGLIGKGFRGRMYWPIGLNETSVDEGGVINTTTVTAFQTAIDLWADGLVNPGGPLEEFTLFRNPTPIDPDADRVPNTITSFDVSPVCTSQRRRRARV